MVNTGTIYKTVFGLIGLAVLFEIAAAVIPTAQTAGNTLNASGIPLGTLFIGTGVVFTIIAAGLLMSVLGYFSPRGRK